MENTDFRKVIIMAVITLILSSYAYGLFVKFTKGIDTRVDSSQALSEQVFTGDPDNPFEILSDKDREKFRSEALTAVVTQNAQ